MCVIDFLHKHNLRHVFVPRGVWAAAPRKATAESNITTLHPASFHAAVREKVIFDGVEGDPDVVIRIMDRLKEK